jgi:hypothetical protein
VSPWRSRGCGEPSSGSGKYHYRYASVREGDAPAAGFAPREAATTVYLPEGVGAHADALERLGPHTTGVGCVYMKDLEAVDLAVLESIIGSTFVSQKNCFVTGMGASCPHNLTSAAG